MESVQMDQIRFFLFEQGTQLVAGRAVGDRVMGAVVGRDPEQLDLLVEACADV